MPESVTDRPTRSHEYVFLLTKSPRYFWDQMAVMEPAEWERWGAHTNKKHAGSQSAASWIQPKTKAELEKVKMRGTVGRGLNDDRGDLGRGGFYDGTGLRNMRSVWSFPTQSYEGAHFATFPDELPRRAIMAGTSEKGCCPRCGAPWVRLTSEPSGGTTGQDWNRRDVGDEKVHRMEGGQKLYSTYVRGETVGWRPSCECEAVSKRCIEAGTSDAGCCPDCAAPWKRVVETPKAPDELRNRDGGAKMDYHTRQVGSGQKLQDWRDENPPVTVGWEPTCACGSEFLPPVPCTVLDLFGGAGTVAVVARALGRRTILVELSEEYAQLVADRTQQLSLLS